MCWKMTIFSVKSLIYAYGNTKETFAENWTNINLYIKQYNRYFTKVFL